jgi:pilus assembly protein CpaF
MALPTSLGATPEPTRPADDESIEIPEELANSVLIDGEALPFATVEEINAVSQKAHSGEFVPSWKDAVVRNPNEKIIKQVAELAYKPVGHLTADDVIENSYDDNYARLEEPVQTLVAFVQKQLHDNNKLDDITQARAKEENKHEEMTRYLDQMILNYLARNPLTQQEDVKVLVAMVINEILGLGPIEPLWHDPKISEIMINGPTQIMIERGGKIITAKGVKFHSQKHLLDVCQQILGDIGRRIDVQHPMEDGRLRDMSRINVVHPSIAPGGPYVTIRRFPDTVFSMEKLVQLRSISEEMAVVLGNLIHAGCSAVIVGGTGTGKTSFLNALSGCISNDERILTVEDNLELRLHPDKIVLPMESRPPSSAGTGGVSIRDIVKNTLRMRPDRIIVGEIRDHSAYDMLQVMNTGHDGSLTTVHADDSTGAVERLRNLVDEAGTFNASTAMTLIAGGVDLFIVIARYEDGSRRVAGIYEVPRHVQHLDNGDVKLTPIPLWEFVHDSTDENDVVLGHYEKLNDISDALISRKRLDKRKQLSVEDIFELSKVISPEDREKQAIEKWKEEEQEEN